MKLTTALMGGLLFCCPTLLFAKEILIEERDTKYYYENQDVTGKNVDAAVGDTIKIVNNDTVLHDVNVTEAGKVLHDSDQKPKKQGGKDIIIPLKEAGTVKLKCDIHPIMTLTVTVK